MNESTPTYMKNFTHQLLLALEQELANLLPLIDDDPISNCGHAMQILMKGYDRLKIEFLNQKLDLAAEIDFFKNDKPKLTSQIIYFNELYKIECHKPVASKKTIRKYYHLQLKRMEYFFVEHADFYRYYRKGSQYLDEKYFVRHQEDCKLAMDSFYFQIDKQFATTHDYQVAQILATEKLQFYLISKLKKTSEKRTTQMKKNLQWTGSKVGLIELIYALHTEGVFNHGAIDVREIVQGFSELFAIDLGQFHRTFYEIVGRKSNRTKFLDALKENLTSRMNQADAYKRLP